MRFLFMILQSFYLFSPLLVAASLSAVVSRFDVLARWYIPLDGGRTLRGVRLFGDNKTWRGLAVAVAGAILGVFLQRTVGIRTNALGAISLLDYSHANPLTMGSAMGLGAVLGELPNSFCKRRMGIAPGASAHGPLALFFFAWDQIDTVLGGWLMLLPWVQPSAVLLLASLCMAALVHPTASLLGYLLGARKSPL